MSCPISPLEPEGSVVTIGRDWRPPRQD